ncbi:MAG: hypothetical protein M5T61_21350 [Acidimicrobiia bacterium]|nr:hypothetical protein [Acidimicrobiia bacterium]
MLWPTRGRRIGSPLILSAAGPDPQTRNWVPGESLHMLAAENIPARLRRPALAEA